MPLPSQTEEFDDVVTSTLQYYVPGEFDQSIQSHPILSVMMANKTESGMGKQVEFIVTYGDNNSVDWVTSSTQKYTFSSNPVMTKGKITPKLLTGAVVFSQEEKEQNSGDEQIANLADARLRQLRATFDRKLAVAFYSNGTVNGKPSLNGLKYWVPTNPGALTVGGLSESTFAFWASKSRTSAGAWATNGWFGSANNYPLNMYINTTDGGRRPKLIISDHGTLQVFLNALGTNIRYISQDTLGKIGNIDDISFMGTRYVWDKDCDSGTMFFLHPEDWFFVVSPGMNFTTLPMDRIPDQPLMSYVFMSLRCQLICTTRWRQGRISGWTVPS